jgi:uncharacterized membrane protein required for colicin V production
MLINFSAIQGFLGNPSVIADIFTVTISTLILINNFNKGFIASLFKIGACYFCGIGIIPFAMNFAAPSTNVPTALVFSIIAFLVSAFVVTNIIDRLTPDGSYSIVDSILGLCFGFIEIFLILMVISACQIYLKKNQNVEIPQWSQSFDQRNITGTLLGLVRPSSEKLVDYVSSGPGVQTLQKKVQDHLRIGKYFKSEGNT